MDCAGRTLSLPTSQTPEVQLVSRRWIMRVRNPFSPQRGEGGQRPDEGWECPRLRLDRFAFIPSTDVTTPRPGPHPVEGRGSITPPGLFQRPDIPSRREKDVGKDKGRTALWLRCSTTRAKDFSTVLSFFTVKPKRTHVSAVQN